LVAATPGRGVAAHIVFGGKSKVARVAEPALDMCLPCRGSGMTSVLLTDAQAAAAAAPPEDADAFDCQVRVVCTTQSLADSVVALFAAAFL
jgi:hypothetical protein